jgi:hypothetical protein
MQAYFPMDSKACNQHPAVKKASHQGARNEEQKTIMKEKQDTYAD